MLIFKIKEKEYKVKFGYNSFCDTDLMERTTDIVKMFKKRNIVDDKDVSIAGEVTGLFLCVRDLLYVGFKKYNPVESVQEVGDILDDYHDEAKEKGEKRGIVDLFTNLTDELMNEGFLADLMNDTEEKSGNQVKVPQDHKNPHKTKASLN